MYKFIKRTLLFTSIFIGIILCVEFSTSYVIKSNSDFHFTPNPKYIVVGHSHPATAFNDSIIKDFKNISSTEESYFYNYFKTIQVLMRNPSIRVIFIEYSNNNILKKDMNNWIYGNKYLIMKYPIYFPFMNISSKLFLLHRNPMGYLGAFSTSITRGLTTILKNDFGFCRMGGYIYLTRDKLDFYLNDTNLLNARRKDIVKQGISKYNLLYLSTLIKYCKKKGKRVILIRSPLHKKYFGYINEPTYKEILKNRYADIEYLDFSKFPLSNSEFGDLEHLNYKGAKVFSIWFADILNKGLLEKPNKQTFIDNEIKVWMHNRK